MPAKKPPKAGNPAVKAQVAAADPGARLIALLVAGQAAQAESEARAMVERDPAFGFGWKVLGIALAQQGKGALDALRQAAQVLPDDAEAQSNLATALREAGCPGEAAAFFRCAIALNPGFAGAHHHLGLVLRELEQLDEAATAFRCAVALDPGYAAAHLHLGMTLHSQGRLADAMHHCRVALEIDPKLPEAIATIAELRTYEGEFAEAEALYRRAIALQPDFVPAWIGIARARKMTAGDGEWLAAVERLAGRAQPPKQEMALRYALGKFFDDVGDFASAFANYRRANDLGQLHALHGYDADNQSRIDDARIRVFDRAWIERHRQAENDAALPILIVGMPRSGTSLAEQILASHPDVFGAGELPFWNDAALSFEAALQGGGDGHAALRDAGGRYLRLLQDMAPKATRVVDKMPANFLYLGMIHAALPQARIIHMQRNPVDTCLSIYFQSFDRAHAYANDLEHLADFYREYRRLMAHWRRTLPQDAILDVPYEALIGDQEGWTRKMLAFAGLPWNERCIDFHRRARTVASASSWQVRQKIGTSSVERWRNYAQFAGPLLSLLDPAEGM